MMAMRIGLLCVLTFLAAACSDNQATPEANRTPPAAPPGAPPATEMPPTVTPPPATREVTEEELKPLRAAVARDLDDVIAQRDLARLLWEGGQYDRALNHFERAVQINPNLPGALRDLGQAYATLGRPSDAEGAFRRMATIPEAYHVALYELGNLAQEQGDAAKAMRFFAESVKNMPDYMDALYSLGVALEQAGRFREAYEAYSRVLQMEPPEDSAGALDYVDALFRMGRLDLKMGAVERAAQILAEVVEAYEAHPEAHYELGRALQLLEREDEAQREFAEHERLLGESAAP